MLVNLPSIPPTHAGVRQFLIGIAECIQASDNLCYGYSVIGDPSGRVAVSATCSTLNDEQYSIRVEFEPVPEQGARGADSGIS